MAKTNIGLFGGAFNPVHIGHLIIAETLREELDLAKVIFIPTYIHPFKAQSQVEEARHRLAMLRLALEGNPYFDWSEVEIERQQTSYTIDTVREFIKKYPRDEYQLFFLLGADNLVEFPRWKQVDELVALCQFVAFGRPGFSLNIAPEENHLARALARVECPLLEISATEIRSRIKRGRSIRYLAPEKVLRYIEAHQLFR